MAASGFVAIKACEPVFLSHSHSYLAMNECFPPSKQEPCLLLRTPCDMKVGLVRDTRGRGQPGTQDWVYAIGMKEAKPGVSVGGSISES